MTNNLPWLWLDLDDVLVDFQGACARSFGTDITAGGKRQAGEWDLGSSLIKWKQEQNKGRQSEGTSDPAFSGLTPFQEFGDQVHRWGSSFWTSLEKLPHYDQLLAYAETVFPHRWGILTTPMVYQGGWCPECIEGKIRWYNQNLLRRTSHFYLTDNKGSFAHYQGRKTCILIDDADHNVTRFTEAGGIAYLFPTYGNSAHDKASKGLSGLDWNAIAKHNQL